MTSFASLMAMSASHTRESQAAIENALAERKRREAQQRKQQEERDAKQREMERKLLLQRLQEKEREQERAERKKKEQERIEQKLARKEEEKVQALLYGKKPSKSTASTSSGGRGTSPGGNKEAVRKRHGHDSDDDRPGSSNALTREELRQRKEMRGFFNSPTKRSSNLSGTGRSRKRLPGGAVDIVVTDKSGIKGALESRTPGMSVKDALSSMPNMLVKLNQDKRDKRTVDEVMRDLGMSNGKVLSGEAAAKFDGWFDKAKKEPPKRPASTPPAAAAASSSQPNRSNTPLPSTTQSAHRQATANSSTAVPQKKSTLGASSGPLSKPIPKMSASASASTSKTSKPMPKPQTSHPQSASLSKARPATSSSLAKSSSAARPKDKASDRDRERDRDRYRKRSRSVSYDDDDEEEYSDEDSPPSKRHRRHEEEDAEDYSSQIWSILGLNRSRYVNRDVFSDDEDMEADAVALEKEELRSARIAKKEDLLALKEEQRREEEKRRRKKDRERSGH